jgi:hypothetical protein
MSRPRREIALLKAFSAPCVLTLQQLCRPSVSNCRSPAVPLLRNLSNRDYCETVYGGSEPEHIAARFSRVDPEGAAKLLTSWRQETILHRIPRKLEKLTNFPEQLARFISVAIEELHD